MSETGFEIAVVGMSGRFPGAATVEQFWDRCVDGQECLERFSEDELRLAGVPHTVWSSPSYVPVAGVLDGIDLFDASRFGLGGGEVELLDPQQRLLLEVGQAALEDAGCGAGDTGRTGVFAALGPNTYLLNEVLPRRSGHVLGQGRDLGLLLASEKDFAATRLAYRLGLHGPALTVQTACSSGLVAVALACRALLAGDCTAALVAAAAVRVPHRAGYLFQDGSIFSRTGHCRPFDAAADGCVPGAGVVAVVLKPLADAVRDGNAITATILSTGLNNDGGRKLSYAAPSVEGQRTVIEDALAASGVTPAQVGFVETHGTGTELGDPVEFEALHRAFGPAASPWCALGGLKANFGHLDAAAGLAGLVKTALAIRHRTIPPMCNFGAASPRLALDGSAFYIPPDPVAWPPGRPPVAGVASFGVGGTNAYAILGAPPEPPPRGRFAGPVPLPLSAPTPDLLRDAAASLADTLRARPSIDLRDVGRTLARGRATAAHRAVVVARDAAEAAAGFHRVAADPAAGLVAPSTTPFAAEASSWLSSGEPAFPVMDGARLVALPPTPLRRSRHWVGPDSGAAMPALPRFPDSPTADRPTELAAESWTRRPTPFGRPGEATRPTQWLVVHHGQPLAGHLAHTLPGPVAMIDAESSALDDAVAAALAGNHGTARITILAARDTPNAPDAGWARSPAFDTPLRVIRALAALPAEADVHLDVVTARQFAVPGAEAVDIGQALAAGPLLAGRKEVARLTTRLVDVPPGPATAAFAAALARELATDGPDVLAVRPPHAWTRAFAPVPADLADAPRLADGLPGPVLIAGASGGIGSALAAHLARERPGIRLGLLMRPAVPTARPSPWPDAARQAGEAMDAAMQAYPAALIHDRPGLAAAIDAYARELVLQYWQDLCLPLYSGSRLTLDAVCEAGAVLPQFRRMVAFQAAMLAADGMLSTAGGALQWTAPTAAASPGPARDTVLALDPTLAGLLDLMARAAASYRAALSGQVDAAGVLYPGGQQDRMRSAADAMLDRSTGKAACAALAAWIVRAAAGCSRPFRVLEVGAGNGLLTRAVMAAVTEAGAAVDYVATDIGRKFVDTLWTEAEAKSWRGIGFGVLDIGVPPGPQGFEPGHFDLVCGLNVVHATPDVAATLANLAAALAPGGALALIESVRRDRWVDMVAGLAADWWAFTDGRTTSPLLVVPEWADTFAAAGLAGFQALPAGLEADRADCALMLATTGSGGPDRLRAQAEALGQAGATVATATADLRDPAAVAAAVASLRATLGPFRSVVQAAGRISGALIRNLGPREVGLEFGARLSGALALVEATRGDGIERVVLSSSATVLDGGEGQAAYVASNASLAGLAHRLRSEGVAATCVHWGRWTGTGLALAFEQRFRRLRQQEPPGGIAPHDALRLLALALSLDLTEVRISGTSQESAPPPAAPQATVVAPVPGNDPARDDAFAAGFIQLCRDRLAQPALAASDTLVDCGIDSIDVLELQAVLEARYRVHVFTPSLLTERLGALAAALQDPASAPATARPVAVAP